MNKAIANRLYLIIVVVTSITIGFVTGYIVGSRTAQSTRTASISSEDRKIESAVVSHTPGEQKIEGKEMLQYNPESQPQGPDSGVQGLRPDEKKHVEKRDVKTEVQPSKPKQEESVSEVSQKGIYAVQAGAFKDKKEADILKTRLEKKGYNNIYIAKESKKGSSLYKVRIGDFETKREADLFAIKLSKSEGLSAFAVKK